MGVTLQPAYQRVLAGTLAILRHLTEMNDGGYFIGLPELGTGADLLSLLRGMDKLSIDVLDHPQDVSDALDVLPGAWTDLHEQLYKMTRELNEGGAIIAWMSLWAPGRHTQLACDFSALVSPDMFADLFLPAIERETSWCEYGTYHLDGPRAMRSHLDALLETDRIKTIHWTPGAGGLPTHSPEFVPAYRRIQEAGKRLYLMARPHEIEPILSELSPVGLFLSTDAESEDQAKELLKKVEQWSAR